MLVCDGRVTTLWACASPNTRPAAARRSRAGVATRVLSAKPTASARSVSMVIRTTSAPAWVGPAPVDSEPERQPAAARIRAANAGMRRERMEFGSGLPARPHPLAPSPKGRGGTKLRLSKPLSFRRGVGVRSSGHGGHPLLQVLQHLPGILGVLVVGIELQ